jgi:hypothetical protein
VYVCVFLCIANIWMSVCVRICVGCVREGCVRRVCVGGPVLGWRGWFECVWVLVKCGGLCVKRVGRGGGQYRKRGG